jgi:hypothetical protein
MGAQITVIFVPATLLYNSPEKLSSDNNNEVKKELDEIRNKFDAAIQQRILFVDKYPTKISDFIDILVEALYNKHRCLLCFLICSCLLFSSFHKTNSKSHCRATS